MDPGGSQDLGQKRGLRKQLEFLHGLLHTPRNGCLHRLGLGIMAGRCLLLRGLDAKVILFLFHRGHYIHTIRPCSLSLVDIIIGFTLLCLSVCLKR